MTAPAPDDIGIWQKLAHLRTENFQWRECVQGILGDAGRHLSADTLKDAIHGRVDSLAHKLAQHDRH